MSVKANLELAHRAWEAVSNGDVASLQGLWDEHIVWHATARGTPWAGDHRGRDVVLDFLARIGESVEIFDARLDDVLASDARVSLLIHVSALREDRKLEVDYQLLVRIHRGLVAEIWTSPLDPRALESFWQA
jgi:ketosteroid isomerase-like protein